MSIVWPYPAPVDDGRACHLVKRLAVPDVDLPAHDGSRIAIARLRHPAVLFIYPWTGRPGLANPPNWDEIAGAHGSTPEVEGFRNLHSGFAASGVSVFGLSNQPSDWHAELAARLSLPYLLLSDAAGALQSALDLPTFETGGVTYLARLSLVIEGGRITTSVYPVHPPDTHAREMLAMLEAARGYAVESRLQPLRK